MATATVGGVPLERATLTVPSSGPWILDGVTTDVLEGAPTVATVGDITLSGTVVRSATFTGSTRLRMIAGAAGWSRTVLARGYRLAGGLQLAPILADAAREVGETVAGAPSVSVGSWYGRRRGAASQVLRLLPDGVSWWVDYLGITRIGQRATGLVAPAFEVQDFDGARGVISLSTDTPAAFAPGRDIADPTIGARTINAVVWHVGGDRLRGEIWTA